MVHKFARDICTCNSTLRVYCEFVSAYCANLLINIEHIDDNTVVVAATAADIFIVIVMNLIFGVGFDGGYSDDDGDGGGCKWFLSFFYCLTRFLCSLFFFFYSVSLFACARTQNHTEIRGTKSISRF